MSIFPMSKTTVFTFCGYIGLIGLELILNELLLPFKTQRHGNDK